MINRQLVFSRQEHLYRHIGFASSSITTSSLPSLVCPSCRSFFTIIDVYCPSASTLLFHKTAVEICLGVIKFPLQLFFVRLSVSMSVFHTFTLFFFSFVRLFCFIYDCLPLHVLCVWNMIRIIMRNDGYWCVYIHNMHMYIYIWSKNIILHAFFSNILGDIFIAPLTYIVLGK